MAIEYHELSCDNEALLQHIAPDVFDHAIRADALRAFVEDPRHVLMLATDQGQVIGMASGFEYFHPDKTPQLFINEVGVTPGYRNRGVGRRLVADLLAYAERQGCSGAWLGTEADNVAGQRCFGSHPTVAEPQAFLLYEWSLGNRR